MSLRRIETSVQPTNRNIQVVDFIRSRDGSAKLVQRVIGDPHRATFETGRYEVEEGSRVCLSSQIGCGRGCSFCVTGKPFEYVKGQPVRLFRPLTSLEIVEQARNALDLVPPQNPQIGFAFMGMGEPFDNITNVIDAIHQLGCDYPQSTFTISTIGHLLGDDKKFGTRQLADMVAEGNFNRPVTLHISLHGSSDKNRKNIVPFARPLEDTVAAAEYYALRTGNPVKLNYVLVRGANDDYEDAHRLGRLLKKRGGLVLKLSTLNDPTGKGVVTHEKTNEFETIVNSYGVLTYRFTSQGTDIHAGCGELAKGKVPKETVLALIQNELGNPYLFQRNEGSYVGKWSLLSGGVEDGEHHETTLIREIREEMGIDLLTGKMQYCGDYQYCDPRGRMFFVHAYRVTIPNHLELRLNDEHSSVVVTNMGNIREFDIAEPLLEELAIFEK